MPVVNLAFSAAEKEWSGKLPRGEEARVAIGSMGRFSVYVAEEYGGAYDSLNDASRAINKISATADELMIKTHAAAIEASRALEPDGRFADTEAFRSELRKVCVLTAAMASAKRSAKADKKLREWRAVLPEEEIQNG